MPINQPNVQIHTAKIPADQRKRPRFSPRLRLSFQDRLLRNSFLACAVLLGILALGNVNAPWATKASQGIKQALTMEIDLDESLGQLSFVQKLMPESALVFFNLSGNSEFAQPVPGELTHPYDSIQPWLMYACKEETEVSAIAEGMVAAVSPLSDGSWGVLIDHGSGMESVTAGLKQVSVECGDTIQRGECIGLSSRSIFLELRELGKPADPSKRLGL